MLKNITLLIFSVLLYSCREMINFSQDANTKINIPDKGSIEEEKETESLKDKSFRLLNLSDKFNPDCKLDYSLILCREWFIEQLDSIDIYDKSQFFGINYYRQKPLYNLLNSHATGITLTDLNDVDQSNPPKPIPRSTAQDVIDLYKSIYKLSQMTNKFDDSSCVLSNGINECLERFDNFNMITIQELEELFEEGIMPNLISVEKIYNFLSVNSNITKDIFDKWHNEVFI